MKLSRRQKRILKRKLKRIAGDAVAVLVGAGMFVGLLIAWANEPMPDWSEYIEENHIGMVQVEGSDTWLTQEEYEQMCKECDAYRAAEQAEEQSYYNAILQSTETPVPTTTAAIGSLDWDADDSYRLAKIAMAEAEGEDTEGKALVILVVLNRVWSDEFPDTIEGVITEDTQFTAYGNGRYDRGSWTTSTTERAESRHRWKNTWTSRKQERQRTMASRKQTITKKMQRKWRNKTWQRMR